MRRSLFLSGWLLWAGLGCGGGDGPAGPGGPGNPLTNGSFSARINGTPWSATLITPAIAQIGQISAVGAGSPTWTMAFAWVDNGPGTYVIRQSIGFNGNVSQSGSAWSASAGIGSGTLTIANRTASRITGTFAFTMQPAVGNGASPPVTITDGQFDITF